MSPFIWITGLFLSLVALMLVFCRPTTCPITATEGFVSFTTEQTAGQTAGQTALLARFADNKSENADEFRVLVSKLNGIQKDLSAPTPGELKTLNLQFRTSHDIEPASSLVARCRAGAVPERDIEIAIDKFQARGHVLIRSMSCSDPDVHEQFDAVVMRTRIAMTTFCLSPTPVMDHPVGPRDPGFWEPSNVSDIAAYKGLFIEKSK